MRDLENATQTCLHLLASDSADVLARCMGQASSGDTIVLLGEGVLLAARPDRLDDAVHWAALRPDADALGLSTALQAARIESLGDDDLVQLITTHRHCLTWK